MASTTEQVKEKIRDNIKKYRKKLDYTRLQLGIKIGVCKEFIYDLEVGRRNPSLDTLCKIANALKVEVYELLK